MTNIKTITELDTFNKSLASYDTLKLVFETIGNKYSKIAFEYISDQGGLDYSGMILLAKEKSISHGWLTTTMNKLEVFGFIKSIYEDPLYFELNKPSIEEFNNALSICSFSRRELGLNVIDFATAKLASSFLSNFNENMYSILNKFYVKSCIVGTVQNFTVDELTGSNLSSNKVRYILKILVGIDIVTKCKVKNLFTYQLDLLKLQKLINMMESINKFNYDHPPQHRNRPDFEIREIIDKNGVKRKRVVLIKKNRRPKE